ncbi:hypothetical protein FHS96_000846 [Sphingomonas zeicaulis]|uniref:hypothetical protein n=1 Tax=Sphingomonas zeicaulis TaxID=1632740 RepID=UPI003D262223
MTRRDLNWRCAGFALSAVAGSACIAAGDTPWMAVLFPLTFAGLPLMIHGKRVGQMFRAERRGHGRTAEVVHAALLRRRAVRRDPSPSGSTARLRRRSDRR